MNARRPGLDVSRMVLAVVLLAVACMVVGVASASAALVHPLVGSFGSGSLSNPQAVAVDQSSGDVYVLDVGTASIVRFDATGKPANFSALSSNVLDGAAGADLTPEGSFSFDSNSAAQVAVDNSGGATDGYVYVANSFAGVVDVFAATGAYVGEITDAGAEVLMGGEACGVATDPSGNVYLSYFGAHIDKFIPIDANPAHDTFVAPQLTALNQNCNVAVDGGGKVYASTWETGPLTEFDSLGASSGSEVDAVSRAVAVDPVNDEVYVDEGDKVAQFAAGGATRTGQSGVGTLSGSSYGVAVRHSTGDLYVSDAGATGGPVIDEFGPAIDIPVPSASNDAPSGVTTSGATFSGTVNPGGSDPLSDTHWRFEYSTDNGSTWTSTSGGDAGTGTSAVPVSEQVSGLLPDQAVQVRLVASNSGGSTTSSVQSFTTTAVAADVTTEPAQDLAPTHVSLQGVVNPHNAPTMYWFEYGATTAYGHSIPVTQDAGAGSGTVPVAAIQRVDGLTPGASYHYRLVAHSDGGTVDGSDLMFATTVAPVASAARAGIPGSGFLPEDRGWEQVSPIDKNGGDIIPYSTRTRAASDGGAATFTSLIGSGDVQGTSIASEYMATRNATPGTTGWTTHAITPKQNPLTAFAAVRGVDPLWEGELSNDLSQGIFRAWSLLSNTPNVANVENLYLRSDLRNPGAGSYTLLTNCTACTTPLDPIMVAPQMPKFADATPDFSHVIFESVYPLVPGATADPNPVSSIPNLYEWDNGTLRLAGILPNGTVATRSVAGRGKSGGFYTLHTISDDGSRIIFTDDSATGNDTGVLYQRIDATSTIQLNASEKTNGSGPGGTDPGGPRPATFWAASNDGTRVFFTTSEQLTNDDTNSAVDLYMYDASAPEGHHLTRLSIDHEPTDQENDALGVIGTSSDGHYVYFVAMGQLVAGKPWLASNDGIYEWHDGTVSYIGRMPEAGDTSIDLPQTTGLEPMAARVTPDGRHLLFVSHRGTGLLGYDQANCNGLGCAEVYVYSADSHQLACASCNPTGAPATADATVNTITSQGAAGDTWHLNHPLSDDGKHVFFSTAEALVPEDVNGRSDVYEYDVSTGTVHLLSSGTSPDDSYFMDASASGSDAFFVTRQQLTGRDNDQSIDLYDARIGGGLPEPPATPAACEGDACRGAGSQPAGGTASGSATFAGPGNPLVSSSSSRPSRRGVAPKPVRLKCRRGFVVRRVHGHARCVKRSARRASFKGSRSAVKHRSAK